MSSLQENKERIKTWSKGGDLYFHLSFIVWILIEGEWGEGFAYEQWKREVILYLKWFIFYD